MRKKAASIDACAGVLHTTGVLCSRSRSVTRLKKGPALCELAPNSQLLGTAVVGQGGRPPACHSV